MKGSGNLATVVLLVAAALTRAQAAAAAPSTRTPGPCTGCIASLPGGTDPRPLLVLLHGDGESAASILEQWEHAAAARGIVVFAPSCPRAEGCTGQSWWKWDGDPSWLLRQIDALDRARAIDRDRMWLAGWSGGGTYIGWNTQALERTFAALVIHGGGVRPKQAACSDPKAGVYFLGGDGNPLHYLTEELHDFYVRCGHDVTWTVVHGADHGGERQALASRREAILDWLATKRRTHGAPGALADAAADAATESLPPTASASDQSSPATSRLPVQPAFPPPARSACACRVAGGEPAGAEAGSALLAQLCGVIAAAALGGRRRRG